MIVLALRMRSKQLPKGEGMGWVVLYPAPVPFVFKGLTQKSLIALVVVLMEEILHHLGCIDSVNNGIFTISAGAGFHPSTVVGYIGNISYSLLVATRRRKRQRLDLISSLTWKLKQRNHERTKNPSSRFHLVFFSTVFTPKN